MSFGGASGYARACAGDAIAGRPSHVRERIDRVRHLRGAGLADRLLAIGRDTAPRLREPFRTADHGDLLYDERGLPA